jgi:hypothetical protein
VRQEGWGRKEMKQEGKEVGVKAGRGGEKEVRQEGTERRVGQSRRDEEGGW